MKKIAKDIYDYQLRNSRKIISNCMSRIDVSVCMYLTNLLYIADYAERIYCKTVDFLCYMGACVIDTSTDDGKYVINLIHLKDELLNLSEANSSISYLRVISSCSIPKEIFIKDTLLYKCLMRCISTDRIEEVIDYLRELENDNKLSNLSILLSGALEPIEWFEDYDNAFNILFDK